MTRVIGVRFRPAGKIYFFATDLELNKQDKVVVETVRGDEGCPQLERDPAFCHADRQGFGTRPQQGNRPPGHQAS